MLIGQAGGSDWYKKEPVRWDLPPSKVSVGLWDCGILHSKSPAIL